MSRIDGFGSRLAAARELAGDLSARELDRLAGVAEGYASMIESGQRGNVSATVAAAYARVLGTTTDYLILGTGNAPTESAVRGAVAASRSAGRKTGTDNT